MRIAVVTMIYNEEDLLPIWVKHYGEMFGTNHCFVIDHGSDDGSTDLAKECSVVRLPRTPMDEIGRAESVSEICSALLKYFDWVIYTDVDELLLADPAHFNSIVELLRASPYSTVRAIGLDVHQMISEGSLEQGRKLGLQRRYARFNYALCKPLATKQSLFWTPGFHSANVESSFFHLYLFHLASADDLISLKRLEKTRRLQWSKDGVGSHQRVTDAERKNLLNQVRSLPPLHQDQFREKTGEYVRLVREYKRTGAHDKDMFYVELHGSHCPSELLEIPEIFRSFF